MERLTKDVYTTTEAAAICGVSVRLVAKWFDTGMLRGWRVPGSNHRRIPREELELFMRAHSIPWSQRRRPKARRKKRK